MATILLLAFSVVFGGASRENSLRLALVELAALPALAIFLNATADRRTWAEHRFAFLLLGTLVALPLLQLIPLPPAIWTRLPGREEPNLALSLAGLPTPWSALSLTPELTWRAALALIPPVAAFLGIMLIRPEDHRRIIAVAIGVTTVSIALGAAQLTIGGPLYPYRTTAAGEVVGFFANRNHLATLCLMTAPFAGAFLGRASRNRRPGDRFVVWACAAFLLLNLFALAAIRSRAGILFAVPAYTLGGVTAWLAAGRGLSWKRAVVVGAALAVLATVAYFGGERVVQRFEGGGASTQSRLTNWPIIAEAAGGYQPIGSGVGSFDAVYRAHEPLEFVDPTFLNHAHNEYLETWLEAGWPGALLVGAFMVWYGRRSWRAWKPTVPSESSLQRSASVAILIVLLHSLVDYPLRTEAIAVIFAICCAILESPAPVKASRRQTMGE